MDTFSAIIPLATIWLAAHFAMGPDFVVTVRTAVAQPRHVALQTVAGICVGTVIWAVAGYFGINTLFAMVPWLYGALKLCGGAYLVYLGLRLIYGSFAKDKSDGDGPAQMQAGKAFRLGLLTNLANPKAALFTASLFAATLPPNPTALFGFATIAVMVGISLFFYGFLVFTVSIPVVASFFAKAGKWLDRLAGVVFAGLGSRFILDDK